MKAEGWLTNARRVTAQATPADCIYTAPDWSSRSAAVSVPITMPDADYFLADLEHG